MPRKGSEIVGTCSISSLNSGLCFSSWNSASLALIIVARPKIYYDTCGDYRAMFAKRNLSSMSQLSAHPSCMDASTCITRCAPLCPVMSRRSGLCARSLRRRGQRIGKAGQLARALALLLLPTECHLTVKWVCFLEGGCKVFLLCSRNRWPRHMPRPWPGHPPSAPIQGYPPSPAPGSTPLR